MIHNDMFRAVCDDEHMLDMFPPGSPEIKRFRAEQTREWHGASRHTGVADDRPNPSFETLSIEHLFYYYMFESPTLCFSSLDAESRFVSFEFA